MQSFLQAHQPEIKGTLSGFDRIRFRGTLRILACVPGLMSYLYSIGVLLTQFCDWSKQLTGTVKAATHKIAEDAGRPVVYMASCNASKEHRVLQIAAQDRITEGLVCVLSCVESCHTFEIRRDRDQKQLVLQPVTGRCLHYYFYVLDPQYGLMHLRLQTWLPFTIHVNINGREWLGQQLQAEGIDFEKRDNCFTDVADAARAQDLLAQQVRSDWQQILDGFVRRLHPSHAELFDPRTTYYWSADETEWATDVMFRTPGDLERIYPALVRHCVNHVGCQDVLKFLGRKPDVFRFRQGEITTSVLRRKEGTRCKHSVNSNSVKMYDKQETVLRIETTINNPRDMRVYRHRDSQPDGQPEWLRMRKGIGDLSRRAEISQNVNDRYLENLAAVECAEPLQKTLDKICRPARLKGRRVRALNPFAPDDAKLLESVNHGEFLITGFRNRDLQKLLFQDAAQPSPATARKRSAKVTRLLRLLRAHHLVHKISKTHRYQLTTKGRRMITAILAAQRAGTDRLAQLAA